MAAGHPGHCARPWGRDARLQFWLEDRVFGQERTLPKFRARELIARSPYWAWEQAAFYLPAGSATTVPGPAASTTASRRPAPSRTTRRGTCSSSRSSSRPRGIQENPVRFRLLAQAMALGVYQQFWILRLVNPAWSYRLNADIEDHAEHEYAALVAEHPEWENDPFPSDVAPGYAPYESLADLFRQIGADEGLHKELSLARMAPSESNR